MSNTVVVIAFNEDGDPASVQEMPKDVLRQRLQANDWGAAPRFAATADDVNENFVGLVIIDGHITVPRPVQVATDYEI